MRKEQQQQQQRGKKNKLEIRTKLMFDDIDDNVEQHAYDEGALLAAGDLDTKKEVAALARENFNRGHNAGYACGIVLAGLEVCLGLKWDENSSGGDDDDAKFVSEIRAIQRETELLVKTVSDLAREQVTQQPAVEWVPVEDEDEEADEEHREEAPQHCSDKGAAGDAQCCGKCGDESDNENDRNESKTPEGGVGGSHRQSELVVNEEDTTSAASSSSSSSSLRVRLSIIIEKFLHLISHPTVNQKVADTAGGKSQGPSSHDMNSDDSSEHQQKLLQPKERSQHEGTRELQQTNHKIHLLPVEELDFLHRLVQYNTSNVIAVIAEKVGGAATTEASEVASSGRSDTQRNRGKTKKAGKSQRPSGCGVLDW